jgi:hypothetical protein
VTISYYAVEGGSLTMTDSEGKPFRGRGGDRVMHKLQTGEDPTMIAKQLTMKIHTTVRGDRVAAAKSCSVSGIV